MHIPISTALSLSLWFSLLALQPAAHGATPPMSTTAEQDDVLAALVGHWRGSSKTWFQPDVLADESVIEATIEAVPGGPFLRHVYEGSILGRPRRGEETIAFNAITGEFQVSWVDSFHMNYAIMFSVGEPTDRGFAVRGEYDVGPDLPPWGWRTQYDLIDDDHVTVTAFNILPDGTHVKAIETAYERVGQQLPADAPAPKRDAAESSDERAAAPAADAPRTGIDIRLCTLIVTDQARALRFYTENLGFVKHTDIPLGEYRWLTVSSPGGTPGVELLLEPDAHAASQAFQQALHADGIPSAMFFVQDVEAEYTRLRALGVEFRSPPTEMGGATSAVFDDTCGNLIQITQL